MSKLIYVADDEKNICFLIENFLEKEGYEVECFGDGESLLASLFFAATISVRRLMSHLPR